MMTQNEIIPTISDGWRGSFFSSLASALKHESHVYHYEWSLWQTSACSQAIYTENSRTGHEGCKQVGRAWNECLWHPKGDADPTANHCLSGSLAAILAMELFMIGYKWHTHTQPVLFTASVYKEKRVSKKDNCAALLWSTEMLESSSLLQGGILFIGCVAVFISGSNNGLLSNKDGTTLVVIWCCGADSVSHMTTTGGFHACMSFLKSMHPCVRG